MSEALSWNHWRANDIFCIHLIKQTFLSLCLDDDEYKSICCRTTFKSSFSSPITWTYHEQWSVRFLLLSLKNKQLCREKRLTCLEGKSFFLDICKTKFFFCLSLTRIFIFPDRSRQLVSSFSKKTSDAPLRLAAIFSFFFVVVHDVYYAFLTESNHCQWDIQRRVVSAVVEVYIYISLYSYVDVSFITNV